MATNYVHEGNRVELPAPYAVKSGDGALVGAIFGVAQGDAAQGKTVVLSLTGVHAVKKAIGAVTVGQRLFWDDTAKQLDTTATGDFCVGRATVAAASGDAVVRILLGPVPALGA